MIIPAKLLWSFPFYRSIEIKSLIKFASVRKARIWTVVFFLPYQLIVLSTISGHWWEWEGNWLNLILPALGPFGDDPDNNGSRNGHQKYLPLTPWPGKAAPEEIFCVLGHLLYFRQLWNRHFPSSGGHNSLLLPPEIPLGWGWGGRGSHGRNCLLPLAGSDHLRWSCRLGVLCQVDFLYFSPFYIFRQLFEYSLGLRNWWVIHSWRFHLYSCLTVSALGDQNSRKEVPQGYTVNDRTRPEPRQLTMI